MPRSWMIRFVMRMSFARRLVQRVKGQLRLVKIRSIMLSSREETTPDIVVYLCFSSATELSRERMEYPCL